MLLTVTCLAVRGADVEGLLVAQQAQQLDGIPAGTRVLRLDLPLAKINADRQETLRAWIAAGGTAWFHTDAAHAVGFETTPPRSDLEAFGKAVSVAPFGSNRLLEGVQRIRYALAQGDALLLPSEDVLALLRAEDLPVGRQESLFVAGWRRYGFGDAFFLPSEVSHTLLDGEQFSANWRRCLTERPTRLFVPVSAVVAMTGMGSDRTQAEGLTSQECIALANAWAAAFERGVTASAAGGSEGRGYMPLDHGDLDRLRAALGLHRPASVAPAAPDMDRVQALAASWLAREQCQTGHVAGALEWLDVAMHKSADMDIAHAWKGCALWTQGREVTRPAPERAALLQQAAVEFDAAQHPQGESVFARRSLNQWAQEARRDARLFALEPPLVELSSPFVVRHGAGDPSVAEAIEGLRAAPAIIASEFGIRLDETEVLLFPDPQEYASYLTAAGYEGVTEWESASQDGRRIFSYFQPGREYVGTMAHEFGHVAVYSISEGGAPVPQWVHEGIACAVTPGQPDPRPLTDQAFRDGALMTIGDLNAPAAIYDRAGAALLYFQSQQMVEFMAQAFGRFAILNVLREMGLGTPADAAMVKVIGMDQTQFLEFWIASEFGQ